MLSYPANSHWRMQALARHGRIDAVLRELRERWARLPSVLKNNTIAERWEPRPDSTDQWSHCAVGPLFVLCRDVAGIRPAEPGFAKVEIRPQLGDLKELELVCHTPRGPITFRAEAQEEGHRAFVTLPADCPGELVLAAHRGPRRGPDGRGPRARARALRAAEGRDDGVRRARGARYLKIPSFCSSKIRSAAPAIETAHCAIGP